jgi:hypothetical protein
MKDNVGIAQKQCNTEDTLLKVSKNYVMVTEVCVFFLVFCVRVRNP